MAISKQQHRRGGNYNNLEITNVKSIQVNEDASASSQLVRKSQAESIAQAAAEGNLVASSGQASLTTAFTSQSMVSFLSAKQDNMSIDSSSTAYLEIVDGTKIKVKQLLSQDVNVDDVSNTLADWLTANPSNTLEEGDILILTSATINQQRSWIHNGGSTGTDADFTPLITDYNEASIRAMFSSGSSFVIYDNGSGQFSLNMGTDADKIGGQTIPVDSAEFSVVNGNTVLAVLKALESYVIQVDASATGGATTLDTRLTSLSGVSGNNLGAFSGPVFPSDSTIKQVLEASSTEHINAGMDRAAIRSQYATSDQIIQNNLDAEIARAIAAEDAEAVTRATSDTNLQNAMMANSSLIISESQTRAQADGLIHQRLDIIEGDNQTVGSVSNGVATSNSFTVQQVGIESAARQAAISALDTKVDNLQQGDIKFIGIINPNNTISIRQELIDAGDTRNGSLITAVDLKAGETFVIGDDLDIGLSDATDGIEAFEKGDKLMVTQDVTSGSLLLANFNVVPANETGLAIQNITGSSTIHLDGNDKIDVKDDSITVDHLQNSLLADINDKRSLTSSNSITSDSDTHFVTDATTGATQNVHFKRVSNTSDALTGTKRAILGELMVASNGSADPANPNFAHTATYATHYNGSSLDMSMSVGGVNSEAVVNNTNAAVYATGQYSLAISQHLGMNAGVTGIAQNAGLSNIGVTGFGKAGGAGNDRGGVFTLSDSEFESYSAYRGSNPIPYSDVALIADAGTSANGKAFVAVGDSVFDGDVVVPSASADNHAVNLGDVKSKEYSEIFDLSANGSITINHGLGTKKIILSVWYNDELSTDSFDIDERTINSFKIHNASADVLSDVEVNIIALS